MSDATPSLTARHPRSPIPPASARAVARLAPAALAATLLVVPWRSGTPAGAETAGGLQAEATQLSQELIQEQLQVNALQHQYEVDSIKVQQDDAVVATVAARVAADRSKVRADRHQLSVEAVNTYINAGSLGLNSSLQVFAGNQEQAASRSEYETVAIGNTTETIALLHNDEVALQATQVTLDARVQADQAEENAAAQATDQAQQVAGQLASKEALVQGQLAVAIEQEREQEAEQAAAARAAAASSSGSGGAAAVTADSATAADPALDIPDPPLPPFLVCVRQAESSGNYGAVSPNGEYMGAFQFSQATWNEAAALAGLPQLVGVAPNTATPAEQDTLAIALYDADGQQPWYDPCRTS